MEAVGRGRVGKDASGSRSRLGRSFFARATRSCFVSGMLDCFWIFRCIGLFNPAKKSITSILAGSLASFLICVLRVLNCQKNVSSHILNAFLPYTQSNHEVLTRCGRSPKCQFRKSLRATESLEMFVTLL